MRDPVNSELFVVLSGQEARQSMIFVVAELTVISIFAFVGIPRLMIAGCVK